MFIAPIALFAAAAATVWFVTRADSRGLVAAACGGTPSDYAIELARARFARGEIDSEELGRIVAILNS